MSGVEAVIHDSRLTEIFKDIGQKKDVEVQIELMILLHVFNVEFSPQFLSSLVLFRRYCFFGKWLWNVSMGGYSANRNCSLPSMYS